MHINKQLAQQLNQAYAHVANHEQLTSRTQSLATQIEGPVQVPRIPFKISALIVIAPVALFLHQLSAMRDAYDTRMIEWNSLIKAKTAFLAKSRPAEEARTIALDTHPQPAKPSEIPGFIFDSPTISLVLAALIIVALLGPVILYNAKRPAISNKLFGRTNRKRAEKKAAIEQEIQRLKQRATQEFKAYDRIGFPRQCFQSRTLAMLREYVETGRATTFSEAINVYAQEEHNEKQLRLQHHAINQQNRKLQMLHNQMRINNEQNLINSLRLRDEISYLRRN